MSERFVSSSGDDGDVIYLLPTIKVLGGAHLRLTPSSGKVRAGYTPGKADAIAALVRTQPYIFSCAYATQQERDAGGWTNVDGFRREYKGGPTIIEWQSDYMGIGRIGYDPWLTIPDPRPIAPVVIHRSPRYQNDLFPWWDVPGGFAGKVVMVGFEEEHQAFEARFGRVPFYPTKNFLELAQVIAGARLFIGNQSAPMAVALGLGVPLVQEVCVSTPNCQLWGRANAQFIRHYGQGVQWPSQDDWDEWQRRKGPA